MEIITLNDRIAKAISKVNHNTTAEEIADILIYFSEWEMWYAFTQICKHCTLNDEAYAKALEDAWTLGIGTGEAITYFMKMKEPYTDDMETYNTITDEVVLYRGCNIEETNWEEGYTYGISWTTDYNVAKFFADRQKDGIVVSTVAKKKDIKAFYNGREEQECIYLYADETNTKIVDKY